jgi:hypothetical protein
LRLRVSHFHDAARQAQIGHQGHEILKFCEQSGAVITGEFHEQDRRRSSDQCALNRRAECGIGQAQIDHDAIDQLHRAGPELHDMLRRAHRCLEARKIHDAQDFRGGQGREL